jgi:hypothetical protein
VVEFVSFLIVTKQVSILSGCKYVIDIHELTCNPLLSVD